MFICKPLDIIHTCFSNQEKFLSIVKVIHYVASSHDFWNSIFSFSFLVAKSAQSTLKTAKSVEDFTIHSCGNQCYPPRELLWRKEKCRN